MSKAALVIFPFFVSLSAMAAYPSQPVSGQLLGSQLRGSCTEHSQTTIKGKQSELKTRNFKAFIEIRKEAGPLFSLIVTPNTGWLIFGAEEKDSMKKGKILQASPTVLRAASREDVDPDIDSRKLSYAFATIESKRISMSGDSTFENYNRSTNEMVTRNGRRFEIECALDSEIDVGSLARAVSYPSPQE